MGSNSMKTECCMRVRAAHLAREYADIKEEIDLAIEHVLGSGWHIMGEHGRRFEDDFTRYLGTRFGVGVNSGSDALYIALCSLGVRRGDEVITVSETFVSTVDAVARNGATPVFVDIDPRTYCMDSSIVEAAITERTRALIPVHLYGHPCKMDEIMEIANRHNLRVIEDASQAHGAEFSGRKVGAFGDIGCFSFYPTKNLGAYGDSGMIVTNDEYLAEQSRRIRNYGQTSKYCHDFIGVNSRMDEIQAAILGAKLRHLDSWNSRRREVAKIYQAELDASLAHLPIEMSYAKHVYHQYVVGIECRDQVVEEMKRVGVECGIHYPIPVHLQKAYLSTAKPITLPVTESVSRTCISLPMSPYLTSDEALTAVSALEEAISSLSR